MVMMVLMSCLQRRLRILAVVEEWSQLVRDATAPPTKLYMRSRK